MVMFGILLGFFQRAADAVLDVGRVLIAAGNGHHVLARPELLGQLAHDRVARADVVGAVKAESLAPRGVGIEAHHRHALLDGRVDGRRGRIGHRAADADAVHALRDELLDELDLFLGVLFVGRLPVDLDAARPASCSGRGRRLPRHAGGLENRVRLVLGDQGEDVLPSWPAWSPGRPGGRRRPRPLSGSPSDRRPTPPRRPQASERPCL